MSRCRLTLLLFTLFLCIGLTCFSLFLPVRAETNEDLINKPIENSIISKYKNLFFESYAYYLVLLGFEEENKSLSIQQFPVLIENPDNLVSLQVFHTALYFSDLYASTTKSQRTNISIPSKVVSISNSPVDKGYLSSQFGMRKDPIHGGHRMHKGIDIAAKYGSEVFPLGDGTVIFTGYKSGFGNMIEIKHGYTVSTRYAHLKQFSVDVGQQVSSDDVIGLIGSSGRSTGPHLHLEVLLNGKQVDPQIFLANHFGSGAYRVSTIERKPIMENKVTATKLVSAIAKTNKKKPFKAKNQNIKLASKTDTPVNEYQQISYQDYVNSVDGLFGFSAPVSFNQ